MGLYGSPDLSQKKIKLKKKVKGTAIRPQKNIWMWIIIIIFSLFFVITTEISIISILTVASMNIFVLFIISVTALIYNLIKQNEIKTDIIILLSCIITFFALMLIIGSISQ